MPAVISLSARELSEFLLRSGSIDSRFTGFDRAQEGSRIHRELQAAAKKSDGSIDYKSEVFLKGERMEGGFTFRIEGRADGIFTTPDGVRTIDEIKTTAGAIDEHAHPEHWAQAKIYAALLCEAEGLEKARVQLRYYQVDEEETYTFTEDASAEAFEEFLRGLILDYLPWAEREECWTEKRSRSLDTLRFPFPSYRPGQREMAGEIYRTMRDGKFLLCQAPTGIGKSMSAIFPSLKALQPLETGSRIFYLTARGTTAAAAENAVDLLRRHSPGLSLKTITLTSKEKLCPLEKRECTPESCPYANGYYDRLRSGMARALEEDSFTRETILSLSEECTLCPFEFQLDISLWCDLIIGDYNYLFDPVVSLKRFFDHKGDYLFLIDEAHNLPDRARDIYSAALTGESFSEATKVFGRKKPKIKTALKETADAFLRLGLLAAEEPNRVFFQDSPPESLLDCLQKLTRSLKEYLDDRREGREDREGEEHDAMLEIYFSVQDFLRIAGMYDDHFTTEISAQGKGRISLLCLDPSDFLSASFSVGRGSVLFSATLSPPHYYTDLCGTEDARCIALPSPFPRENLGLFVSKGVSTRYKDREKSAALVASYLYAMVSGKVGNYMAFFPGYAYMEQVLAIFTERFSWIETIVQTSGMDETERSAFLERFSEAPEKTLLGFTVMGGIFGEGIDLTGTRLIGTAVIGVGLPMVSPRQEKLREYLGESYGDGFSYAYRYPGMNRVLQAAGRVIRTDTDRGIVLLIDDRYLTPDYRALIPPQWQGGRIVRTPEELVEEEERFWK